MNRPTNCTPFQFLKFYLFLAACIGILLLQGCAAERKTLFQPSQTGRQSPAAILLGESKQAIGAGRYNQAEILVERALRIEPDNAELWHSMGIIKYNQKNYAQSVQFCLKSNSLAGKNHSLTDKNASLIEKAYRKLGQFDGPMETGKKVVR